MVDVDASLDEEFLNIAVLESVAQVPAHGQQDHLGLGTGSHDAATVTVLRTSRCDGLIHEYQNAA